MSTAGLPEPYELIQSLGILSVNDTYIAGVAGGIFADAFVDRMSHLEEVRRTLERKLALRAKETGANALVGVQFQYAALTDHYYGVFAIGTAVGWRVKRNRLRPAAKLSGVTIENRFVIVLWFLVILDG